MSESSSESGTSSVPLDGTSWFVRFQESELSRLRVALVSSYGVDIGGDATADAISYAWEHRDRLGPMDNPVGYLFRVGQTSARRHLRQSQPLRLPAPDPNIDDPVDPELPRALARLSDRQRTAVVLVHANGWTHDETAAAMGVDVSTVRTHLARGLAHLRRMLEEVRR